MALLSRLRQTWKRYWNKRLYRRIPVDVPVRIYRADTEETLDEKLGNWSPDGLFIQTQTVIPLGTAVDVEFSLSQEGGTKLKLRGQVVRHMNRTQGDGLEGIGIMFTDYTQSGLLILRDLLSKVYPTTEG